jgi:hypothetical protein
MIANMRRSQILWLTLVSLCFVLAPSLNAQQQPVAFVDVALVPMDSEQIRSHQTVVVVAGRIALLGAFRLHDRAAWCAEDRR